MNVGIYARVSTQEQAAEGYSIQEQEERLVKYCDALGWNIYNRYIDAGFSGASLDRPAMKRLISDVKDGKIKKVIVYKLDRLSRSQLDTLYLIEKVFIANGADFVSMTENFDTSTAFGKAMVGTLAVFAQLEREQIKERMSLGKEARVKSGYFIGAAQVPLGYDYVPEDKMLVPSDEAVQVRRVFELFTSGKTIAAIEKLFADEGLRHKYGTWNRTTIRNVLMNPVYIGKVKYKDKYYEGRHEKIVPLELFNSAQEQIARNRQLHASGRTSGRHTTICGGLLYCAQCGHKYAKAKKQKWSYYTCSARLKGKRDCRNKLWRTDKLDSLVLNEVKKLLVDTEWKPVKPLARRSPEAVKKQIARIDSQVEKLVELYSIDSAPLDSIERKMQELNGQRKRLEAELVGLTEQPRETEAEVRKKFKTFAEVLEAATFEQTRDIVTALIDKIYIDGDDVSIHWKY